MLYSTTVSEHEGKLYCKPCHSKQFGLKKYDYGGGADTIASSMDSRETYDLEKEPPKTSGISAYGSPNSCPRCGRIVYLAEKIVGAGSSWHKSCFSCSSCKKKLDSTTVCDNDGEIFCKGCYGKNFGPKGFGFGAGAGALTMTE